MRTLFRSAISGMTLLLIPLLAVAQNPADSSRRDSIDQLERLVKRQRQGAGFRIGSWQMMGAGSAAGSQASGMPALEGYWQKGLDRHLALETSVGFWQRSQRSAGGAERVTGYVIPMLTALKVYPTSPEQRLEPFLLGGLGFTIGVDDRATTTSGGVLGGSSGGGILLIPGFGVKLGGGVEYRIGAFGFAATTGYQYVRFFQDMAGAQTYKGVQAFGGVTYRFQY